MNKPNKSIIAIRKLGLIHATSSHGHKVAVERFESRVYKLCDAETEVSTKLLIKSYMLGLRGIRIGQEASHANTK